MSELLNTVNLNIPRIMPDDIVMRQKINQALDRIDVAALSIMHEASKAHFAIWKPRTAYLKEDIVRTQNCPSWGFYRCTVAGISGITEPAGAGEGDIVVDGTTEWELKAFGSGSGGGAADWQNGKAYKKYTMVVYNRLLYRCLYDHIATLNFDPNKWYMLNVDYLPNWQATTWYEPWMTVVYNDKIYRAITAHTSAVLFTMDVAKWEMLTNKKNIIKDWITTNNYEINECVLYNLHLYRCKTAHLSTTFATDAAKWEIINVDRLLDWQPGYYYENDELVRYLGFTYRAKTTHTSGAIFLMTDWELLDTCYIPDWQVGIVYEPNMTIIENRLLYRCKTAHTSAVFLNETVHWEQVGGVGASIWQAGQIYNLGQIVFRNGLIYSCTIAH